MKIIFEIMIIALFTSPFWVSGLYFLYIIVQEKLDKRKEKINGPKQHLMFSQLKKGNFVWEVTGDKIKTLLVKNVEFYYDSSNNVRNVHIDFVNNSNGLLLSPESAKTFLHGCYHTLMGDAESTRRLNEIKRKKEVEKLTTATAKEVKEQADKVIKNLERLKITCL